MKATADTVTARLESALGRQAVQHDLSVLAAHAVDGVIPSVKVVPSDAAQIGEVLKICGEMRAGVVPWGGGTSMGLGNVPSRTDVVLSLERLDALMEHDDANLTATVQAGMRAATFQQVLGRRRQFLAIDPPRPADATVGGIVAANTNGPRRMLYGGVRDQVIGMKVVLATGEQVKAGGKVVKNVAGYDMCKLFTGSLGTLGVITEVTFRMAPVPERAATVLASGTMGQALEMVERLHTSMLLPAAVTVANARAAATLTTGPGTNAGVPGKFASANFWGGEQGPGNQTTVIVWVEGFTEAVDRHLNDLRAMAKDVGMTADVLEGTGHQNLWERVCDFSGTGLGTLFRLIVPLGVAGEAIAAVDGWSPAPQIVAHTGSGTIWIFSDADGDARDVFARLTALAESARGHAIIAAASPAVKAGLDVWGSSPPGLSIMQEIKRQLDPEAVLNPGRFVAHL